MDMPMAPAEILLVEDDLATARLVREALKGSTIPIQIQVARDGEVALAMLRRQEGHGVTRRPDLILLDLNLPRKDGFAVIADLKQDPLLKRIPVLVLTTSPAPSDIQRCYDLGANCYIVKPRDLLQMMTKLQLAANFWLTAVTLPVA
jgi:chemotaxis family two-component system response regulator Rcp1